MAGRSDTRYSPVRRSPSGTVNRAHAAPRLACVKPVASVHPEPGSNSSLYNVFSYFFPSRTRRGKDGTLSFVIFLSYPKNVILISTTGRTANIGKHPETCRPRSMPFGIPGPTGPPSLRKAGAKIRTHAERANKTRDFF